MNPTEQEREYRTVLHLVSALANVCCCTPELIIDRLIGFAWEADEAALIKAAKKSHDS